MSLELYKVLHILGIALIIMPLGGLILHTINGGTRQSNSHRKLAAMTHGIGMLITIVAGFGMLARLGISGLPTWTIAKIVIWLALGGVMSIIFRAPKMSRMVWWLVPTLTAAATYLAIFKPS